MEKDESGYRVWEIQENGVPKEIASGDMESIGDGTELLDNLDLEKLNICHKGWQNRIKMKTWKEYYEEKDSLIQFQKILKAFYNEGHGFSAESLMGHADTSRSTSESYPIYSVLSNSTYGSVSARIFQKRKI